MKVYPYEYKIDFPVGWGNRGVGWGNRGPQIKATLKVQASDMEFQVAHHGLRELAANALAKAMKDKSCKFVQDVHATLGPAPCVDIREMREDFGAYLLDPNHVMYTHQDRHFEFDAVLTPRPPRGSIDPKERMEMIEKLDKLGIDLPKVEKEEEKKLNIERKDAPWYE